MSEYDDVIREIRDMHQKTASTLIPKAYSALIAEGLEPFDARDKIEKDLIDIFSKRTIRRNLPEEAKHVEMKRERPMIAVVTNEGKQDIGVVTPTGYRPLPVATPKLQTQKIKLTYDLEIRGQVIPLQIIQFIDWDNHKVDVDSIEVSGSS